MTRLVLLLFCLLVPSLAIGEDTIHKCRAADGTLVFSDEPCSNAPVEEASAPSSVADDADEERWCDAAARLWLSFDVFQANADVALNDAQKPEVDTLLKELSAEGMVDTPLWRLGPDESLHFCASRKVGDRIEGVLAKNGERRVVKRGFVKLMNDPETPLALRERCVGAVNRCMQSERAVFDTCVARMPSCSTREPWRDPEICCPLLCKQRYARAREKNVPASTAFEQAMFADGGCIPGLSP